MARRIPSCIGFDDENLTWLRHREDSMADFLNTLVKEYRTLKPNEVSFEQDIKKTIAGVSESTENATEEVQVKIRAYFLDSPHIIYMAKTQRKFNKADLCRIKEELFFSKYNVEANVKEIRKILKEAIDAFDVEAYKEKVGIKNATN